MLKTIVQKDQLCTIQFGRLDTKPSFPGDINRHPGIASGEEVRFISALCRRHSRGSVSINDPGDLLAVVPPVAATDNGTLTPSPEMWRIKKSTIGVLPVPLVTILPTEMTGTEAR